ncbi:DUF3108 domain-containing protein [Thalassotalea maritima]|uniref:DUF3108 domain-containing protein n=1 Tax=Thalassotalea maritima TaxID=3242416 RepID=UPI003526EDE2
MGSNYLLKGILLMLTFPLVALAQQETVSSLANFEAKYNIVHEGDVLGKAKRSLINHDDGSVEFNYQTNIKRLIFSDHRQEQTQNIIRDGEVIPLLYQSSREGTGKDKFYKWAFDKDNQQVTNLVTNQSKQIDWPDGLQSKLSFHLQTRLNLINGKKEFNFKTLTTSGGIKDYNYQLVGNEQIDLPYGTLDTVKLMRQKPGSDRVTYVWFAPELDYLMVKLHQKENSFNDFEAQLVSVDLAKK